MSWHRYYPLKLLSPFAFTHFCNLCGQLTQASFALACNLPVFHSAVINSRAFLFSPAPRTSIHLGDRSDFSGPQISSIGCKSGEFAGKSTFLIPWIFRYYSNCLAAFICDDALSSASYTVLLGFTACTYYTYIYQIYFYSRFCFVRAVHAPRCSSSFSPETHSFLHCICSCASLTHVSHLFKRYTHSCVVLSLSSHVSATQPGGLPDLFFSLTCIRPQNSWPDCLVVCALH